MDWGPFLVAGAITLLTSRWKIGKTTLLAALLRQLQTGGELGGLPVEKARAIVVTEESPDLWSLRAAAAEYDARMRFIFSPFAHAGRSTLEQWKEFLLYIRLQGPVRGDVVVIDPVACCFPAGAESNPDLAREVFKALRTCSEFGLAVLLLHHPAKRSGPLTPRGTGALSALADILVEMDRPFDDPRDRRRRLRHESRFDPPGELWVERSEDNRTFARAAAPAAEDAFAAAWPVLKGVIEDQPAAATRVKLQAAWPADHPRPDVRTLLRWLERAAAAGLVVRSGLGRSNRPYEYALPVVGLGP